jgi:hypothetical protein
MFYPLPFSHTYLPATMLHLSQLVMLYVQLAPYASEQPPRPYIEERGEVSMQQTRHHHMHIVGCREEEEKASVD